MRGKACGDDDVGDDIGDGDDDDGDGDGGDDDGFFFTPFKHNVPGMATLNDDDCDDVNTPEKQFLNLIFKQTGLS